MRRHAVEESMAWTWHQIRSSGFCFGHWQFYSEVLKYKHKSLLELDDDDDDDDGMKHDEH